MTSHTAPRRVEWICQQPTPYNDALFRALGNDPAIDLTVHFINPALATHPWESKLAAGFRSRTYQPFVLNLDKEVLRRSLQADNFFVIAGWHEPTVQAAILLRGTRRFPFALLTDSPRMHRRALPKALVRNSFLSVVFKLSPIVLGTGSLALSRLASMGCPPAKLVNFPYFIDTDEFHPGDRQCRRITDELVFLSSGRLVNAIKAHDQAIEAIAAVKHHFAGVVRYRIAGTGPDHEALASKATALGVDLEIVGWLEPHQLPAFYQSGDVLLHPSHHDAYATAILEAMATGLAIVGSDNTGVVVDRILHGQNGLIHRAGDVVSLTDAVATLCRNPDRIRELGAAARITADEWPLARGVKIIKSIL